MERRDFPQYKDDLGCFLCDLRTWVFKTQIEAAGFFGISHGTVSRYESGEIVPPLSYVAGLAVLVTKHMQAAGRLTEEQRGDFLQELNNKVLLEHYPGQRLQDWDDVEKRAKLSPQEGPPLREVSSLRGEPPWPLPSSPPRLALKTALLLVAAVVLIVSLLVASMINGNPLLSSKTTIWQEDFDPIKKPWDQPSARWDDIEGRGAILVEDGPGDFGKVESEIINVDIQSYPILKVDVSKVDLHACFSVQLLDKEAGTSKTVIENEEGPGLYTVNLADEMGWQGSHSFTINIWISGEGKSATFNLISIEAK